jgi:hypothetical protein
MHTVALVGTEGTIDWLCMPRFDAPSVFAAILDVERGGEWALAPEGAGWRSQQLYLPDTAMLITRFLSPEGHRRRAGHESARGHRRRAEPGLPLHVDPRRSLHRLRAAASGLH